MIRSCSMVKGVFEGRNDANTAQLSIVLYDKSI